jgi:gluconate kinase
LVEGKDYKIQFKFDKGESTLVITISALRTLKGHFLNISPKYFHFLPLQELVDQQNSRVLQGGSIFSDSGLMNSFLNKLIGTYSKEEMDAILNFKLSKSFQDIPINLA